MTGIIASIPYIAGNAGALGVFGIWVWNRLDRNEKTALAAHKRLDEIAKTVAGMNGRRLDGIEDEVARLRIWRHDFEEQKVGTKLLHEMMLDVVKALRDTRP